MAFTVVTITGTYHDAEGNPLSGTVSFTLSQSIANSDVTVMPLTITETLDDTGGFSVDLVANNDTGTSPTGSFYNVTESLSGESTNAQSFDYAIWIDAGAGSSQDISQLRPGQPGWS